MSRHKPGPSLLAHSPHKTDNYVYSMSRTTSATPIVPAPPGCCNFWCARTFIRKMYVQNAVSMATLWWNIVFWAWVPPQVFVLSSGQRNTGLSLLYQSYVYSMWQIPDRPQLKLRVVVVRYAPELQRKGMCYMCLAWVFMRCRLVCIVPQQVVLGVEGVSCCRTAELNRLFLPTNIYLF